MNPQETINLLGSLLILALLGLAAAITWARVERSSANDCRQALDELHEQRASERRKEIDHLYASTARLTDITNRARYPEFDATTLISPTEITTEGTAS